MSDRILKGVITPWTVILLLTGAASGRIIYVDADANGLNDGSSWANAYLFLQDALQDANSDPSINEICVAAGIYTPDSNTDDPNGSDDREATFQLLNGVALRGGYAGYGEPDPNARDTELYETILSGDLNGDDVDVNEPCDLPTELTRAENSYHVVTGSGTDANAVIDGFTITAGYNDFEAPVPPSGGGMFNLEGSPTVRNCTFSSNMALAWGYGMGGGMYNYNSSATIIDCTFSRNMAGAGGGMHNRTWRSNNKTVVVNCTFIGNYAKEEGGGVRNYTSSPTLINCTFSGNSAGDGGGMFNNFNCTPMVTNCTFSGNIAVKNGGGICNENNPYYGDSTPIVTNCILWNNIDSNSVDEYAQICGGIPTVNYNCTQGWTGALGGTGNIDTDPCFVGPGYWTDLCSTPSDTNDDVWLDGDYHLLPDSPCIDAGDNSDVPPDVTDLDGDGDTDEPLPFDLDGNSRMVDGNSDGNAVVDMGAYEYFVPPVECPMHFTPRVLNPKSKGKWVKAHLVLPDGYTVEDVDTNYPCTLTEPFEPDIESAYMNVFINDDGLVEIEAAFDRRAFCQAGIGSEVVEVRVEGRFISGQGFFGTDTIRVIDNTFRDLGIMASYWLEGGCGQPDWCAGSDINQNSVIDFADFALIDDCCIEVVAD